jgi:transcription antitermination factor NusA-like protein
MLAAANMTAEDLKDRANQIATEFDSSGIIQQDEGDMANISVTIVVGERGVAWLIGRGGANINQIKAISGANVSFAKKETSIRSSRKCAISGNVASVAKAIMLVVSLLQQSQGSNEVGVVVQNNVAGAVIGKAGCNLKQIREQTGCRVGMEKPEEASPAIGGRCLTLSHPESSLMVAGAVYAVLRTKGFASPSIQSGSSNFEVPDFGLGFDGRLGMGPMGGLGSDMFGLGYGAAPSSRGSNVRFSPYAGGRVGDPNTCVVHGKRRGPQNLQASVTVPGSFECLPHDKCKMGGAVGGGAVGGGASNLGLGMIGPLFCSKHGKKRGAQNLQVHPSIPNAWICLESDQCK